jgi:hypothetical protein
MSEDNFGAADSLCQQARNCSHFLSALLKSILTSKEKLYSTLRMKSAVSGYT